MNKMSVLKPRGDEVITEMSEILVKYSHFITVSFTIQTICSN